MVSSPTIGFPAARARRINSVSAPFSASKPAPSISRSLSEIAAVVGSEHKLLTRINLERIRIAESDWPLAVICTEFATLLNRKNPAMKRALREALHDPACMWFVVSAVYTALNVFFEEVTDEDEAQFLVLLTRRAVATLG